MSEPITNTLRSYLYDAMVEMPSCLKRAFSFCDNIDAVHRSLEQENERLRERLKELDNADSSMQIGEVTVTITPRIDWTAVADDLRDAAKALCERTREGEE